MEDGFHFKNPREALDEDIAINNAAHSVVAAYEAHHPEVAEQINRLLDMQKYELVDELRHAELVQKPNEELYWIAREYIARTTDLSDITQ